MAWKIFTGQDNSTPDIARVLAAISVAVFLLLSGWTVIKQDKPFDAQGFGVGIGSVFASVGACLYLKKDTEPKP